MKTARLALISALFLFLFVACSPAPENTNNSYNQEKDMQTTTDTTPATEENATTAEAGSQTAAPQTGDTIATIETEFGTIKFKLFTQQVPEITKSFMELAKAGNYNGAPFHRVMKNFMIQTGDFTRKNGTGGHSYKGPGTELPDEIVPELKHLYGTVSMANHGPDTNGSQFFIVTNPDGTSFLDGDYTVFGQVFEGMDVAEKIQNLQVPGTEKPSEEVHMTKVTVGTL